MGSFGGRGSAPAPRCDRAVGRCRVVETRHPGEVTLATLSVDAVPGAHLVLTLAGAQRQALSPGARLRARLDPDRVHVLPLRTDLDAAQRAALMRQ